MQEHREAFAGISELGESRLTLKDEATSIVRRALMSGDMEPGKIYSANALASQLGVSNSPVREAMMALSEQGLLEVVRNRGFRVVEMSPKDQREVYDLRLLIEVTAVGRVAEQGVSPADARRLAALNDAALASARPDNMVDYLERDQQFHLSIVELLGNTRMTKIIENLRDQSRISGSYHLAERGLLATSAAEHGPILTALLAGDRMLTESLMVEHLSYSLP
ncbi:GntR family transcriptional regulator [Arthrobacter sp. 2YAF22_2]|jgi:DNA-binding GntR family transcriptional regulator|uniref:GntR family transcriptional regulator n=1 Tax=Arthrobacter sp. 2YAF22_2 TaxID=3233029 RepID=UPI003F93D55E